MGLGREEEVEIRAAPRFMPGEKVQSTKHIKNDGTYPRREIGDILVRKGDVGYVRDIGTFLQQFYVYAVEFVDRAVIVGMRGRELVSLDHPVVSTGPADRRASEIVTPAADAVALPTSETVAS
ncbi:nitrogen fixation protein NifZ [Rhodoplanes azumiensis]|uniref:Nitrogen fixation protein NifZ n=1 Tax=Rhodoplanes azumiensis TaxID=1897628 RepID=A0ABW5AIS8_9BRAD